MNRQARAYPASYRRSRTDYIVGYIMYLFVAARMLTADLKAGFPTLTAGLLGIILLLLLFEMAFLQNHLRWRDLYFLLGAACIQALGLIRPDEDVWALMYPILAGQALFYYSLPIAIGWSVVYVAFSFITLAFTTGILQSVAFCLTYTALGALMISYSIMYTQAEAARQESQRLLTDLERANRKLKDYAAQIEEIATLQERNRLAHELHDSVSQMIFSISLSAEAAGILVDKDPNRLPALLDQLQEQTSSALAQMRALIQQWRPN